MRCLLFFLIGLLPVFSWAAAEDFHALIISADDSYVKNEADLNYATLDAERMLRAIRTVGQVPNTNISILNNPKLSEVSKVVNRLKKKKVRKFLFYYSGHSDEEGLNFKNGRLSRLRFHKMLKEIPAKTKIVVLDSCFSGALKRKGVKSSKPIELVKYDMDEPTGSVILTSSSQKEFSYESEKLRGSIFTYHLVSGLYGQADGNEDGVVTISELYQYVYAQTKYQSLVSGGVTQHPEFQSRLSGRGALVVSFPAKTNGQFKLARNLSGELTLASVNGMNFFKFYKDEGEEREISVPSGGYLLTLDGDELSGSGQARLAANQTVRLKKSDFKWRKRGEKEAVNKKGAEEVAEDSENEFHFGAALGTHSSFVDELKAGPALELLVLSPHTDMIWGKWRLVSYLGGQTHQNQVSGGSGGNFNRFTFGFEGNYPGFSSVNQEWIVGLRFGRVSSFDGSLSNFTLGARFSPKSWSVKWGIHLNNESLQLDSGEKREASMLSLLVLY